MIEGASEGKGLGIQFLRHLERTKLLLHLVDISDLESFAQLEVRLKTINGELKSHSMKLGKIPQVIVFTKTDAFPDKKLLAAWKKKLVQKKKKVFAISAVSGEGLKDMLEETWKALTASRKTEASRKPEPPEKIYLAKQRFFVSKEDDGFHVRGSEIEKWVAMTNFNIPDALERFYKILRRMGVLKELKKKGVQDGDTVYCGKEEMTFTHDYLEGRG